MPQTWHEVKCRADRVHAHPVFRASMKGSLLMSNVTQLTPQQLAALCALERFKRVMLG